MVFLLSGCLVRSTSGDPQPLVTGESQLCHVERYCRGVTERLPDQHECTTDVETLRNDVAYQCWVDGGSCSGGHCNVMCEGNGVVCLTDE